MVIASIIATLIGISAYIVYEAQHIVEIQDMDNFFDSWAPPPPEVEIKVLPAYGIWYEDAIKQGIIQGKTEKARVISAFKLYQDTYQPFFLLDDDPASTFNQLFEKESNRFVETIRLYKGYDAYFMRYFHTPGLEEITEEAMPKNIYKEWKEWEACGYTYKSKFLNKIVAGKHHFSSFGYAKELDYRATQGACKKCLYAEARFITPLLGTNLEVNPADADAFVSHKVMKHWWKLITK